MKFFHFPLRRYDKGFLLSYERFETIEGIEQKIIYPVNEEPNNPNLPQPKYSVLRNVLDNHLLEITFKGKINLEFHSWWDEDAGWKYWKIVK